MKRSATVALAHSLGLAGCASDQRMSAQPAAAPGTTLTAQLTNPKEMTESELDQVSGGFFLLGAIVAGALAGEAVTAAY